MTPDAASFCRPYQGRGRLNGPLECGSEIAASTSGLDLNEPVETFLLIPGD
jgi:hypothetical protein